QVMTAGEIRDASRIARLRLKLRGLGPEIGAGREITVERATLGDAPRAAGAPDTQATPFVESDAEEIVALAREVVPQGAGVAQATRAIVGWVQANVRQGDTVGPPSALATLHTRRGNCNELAVLTAALLRAAGV